jgi:cytochrome c553
MGEARSQEVALLEERRRVLVQQKKELQKDIKNKQQRAKRLMKKAVKDLSDEQLLQVAAARVASRAKARAKSTATSSAPTTAPLGSRTAAVSSPTEAADGDQSNA